MFAFVVATVISINVTLVVVDLSSSQIYTNVSEKINTARHQVSASTPFSGHIDTTETPGLIIIASSNISQYDGGIQILNSTYISSKMEIKGRYSVNPFYGYGSKIFWSAPTADEDWINESHKITFEVVWLDQIQLACICFKDCIVPRIN